MLTIHNVSSGYDSTRVLSEILVEISGGEIAAVLGSNGAGKTTLLRTISGSRLIKCYQGNIQFEGQELLNMSADQIVKAGVVQVPQERGIVGDFTVEENLVLGTYCHYFELGDEGRRRAMAQVFAMFPILAERKKQKARTLSGGQQQMLAISKALMAKPRILLLDEPSLGIGGAVLRTVFESLLALKRAGIGILLVEQRVDLALKYADKVYILQRGRLAYSGTGKEFVTDRDKLKGYYL